MFGLPSGIELLIFGTIAILLFRDRVVGVARPVGKAVGHLRKAKQTVRREMTSAVVDALNSAAGEGSDETAPSPPAATAASSAREEVTRSSEP